MALLKTSCWGDISLRAYQQSSDELFGQGAHETANFPKDEERHGEVPWFDTLLKMASESGTDF